MLRTSGQEEEGGCFNGKKRGNGEGSIYQRENGTWAGQLTYFDIVQGKKRRLSISGRTRKEVQDKMHEAQNTKLVALAPRLG